MRKPSKSEMTLLLGALVIGTGAHADETQLDPINVTADYISPGSVSGQLVMVTFSSYSGYGNPMTGSGKTMVERADNCVQQKYGDAGYNTPNKPITYTMQYGFAYGTQPDGSAVGVVTSYNSNVPTQSPPFPYNVWQRIGGITNSSGSTIFRDSIDGGMQRLINATAHEIAHQNKADEATARAKGLDAENRYLADPVGC